MGKVTKETWKKFSSKQRTLSVVVNGQIQVLETRVTTLWWKCIAP